MDLGLQNQLSQAAPGPWPVVAMSGCTPVCSSLWVPTQEKGSDCSAGQVPSLLLLLCMPPTCLTINYELVPLRLLEVGLAHTKWGVRRLLLYFAFYLFPLSIQNVPTQPLPAKRFTDRALKIGNMIAHLYQGLPRARCLPHGGGTGAVSITDEKRRLRDTNFLSQVLAVRCSALGLT